MVAFRRNGKKKDYLHLRKCNVGSFCFFHFHISQGEGNCHLENSQHQKSGYYLKGNNYLKGGYYLKGSYHLKGIQDLEGIS